MDQNSTILAYNSMLIFFFSSTEAERCTRISEIAFQRYAQQAGQDSHCPIMEAN